MALAGLEKLKNSGRVVGVVSGCSFGWGACLIRLLPIDLIIVENGAAFFTKDDHGIHCVELTTRENRKTLLALFSHVQRSFPQLRLAGDDELRRFDCAIDIAQEQLVDSVTVDAVIKMLMAEKGVQARPSSIHINFWKGSFGKAPTLERWLTEKNISKESSLYVGDSLNDEPLFKDFAMSVGVANVRRHLAKMKTPPVWILEGEGGEGFAELSDLLCRR